MSSLVAAVGGPYSATYNSLNVGHTEKGYTLEEEILKEEVKADAYGDMVMDAFYRGLNVTLNFIGIEWSAAATPTMLCPYSATAGVSGQPGQVARLMEGLAQVLVLTDVALTASDNKPASLTANKAIRHERTSISFASLMRKVDFQMRLFPYLSTEVKHYVLT